MQFSGATMISGLWVVSFRKDICWNLHSWDILRCKSLQDS